MTDPDDRTEEIIKVNPEISFLSEPGGKCDHFHQIVGNFERIEDSVSSICEKAGRQRSEITIVAVSKFHSAADIACIHSAGQIDFGENYYQEYERKQAALEGMSLRWHMIGHLQTRKASRAAGNFSLIHSLDSVKLADALEKNLSNRKQDVLLEINIGNESQKSGIARDEAISFAGHIMENCPHLNLRGLMCLPPLTEGRPERWFAGLASLRDRLERELSRPFPDLSMGMTGDYAVAIAEGATIVRIGTGIFGKRPKKSH